MYWYRYTVNASWKTWLRRALRTLAGVLGFFVLIWLLVWMGVFGHIPTRKQLANIQQEEATLVYSADQKLIGKYFAENRTNVVWDDIPSYLIDALIATEDVRFYEHAGIDFWAMMRVLGRTILLQDESAGGGSTITQQLAKNLYGRKRFWPLTILINKSKELILAKRIEDVYSKDEILVLYLNTVPFGEDVYGVESASQRYFNKSVDELTLLEASTLVGMLKANTYYNPYLHPDRARSRRNVVLSQMAKYEFLRPTLVDSLKSDTLVTNYSNLSVNNPTGYFLKRVQLRAEELLKDKTKPDGSPWDIRKDGLVIRTTLNAKLQELAVQARKDHLKRLQAIFDKQWPGLLKYNRNVQSRLEEQVKGTKRYQRLEKAGLSEKAIADSLEQAYPMLLFDWDQRKRDTLSVRDSLAYYLKLLHASVFGMDVRNGAVLTYVGGNSYERLPYDLITSRRQAASTFKPFVFAAAIQRGIDPCEWIKNEPISFPEYNNWTPQNYDGSTGGFYSMRGALAKSVNLITVQLYQRTGREVLQSHLRELGLPDNIPARPAVALGTESFSVQEMVQAYSVYANGGKRVEPYFIQRIEDKEGNVIYEHKSTKPKQVIEGRLAADMQYLLKGVVDSGTASSLKSGWKLQGQWAGKTGTAQDYADAWFIGFNANVAMGVWVGAQYPAVHFATSTGSGSAAALPIFAQTTSLAQYQVSKSMFVTEFPALVDSNYQAPDCDFYRKENFFDKIEEFFEKLDGDDRDRDTTKRSLWERIFGEAPLLLPQGEKEETSLP